MKNKVIKPGQLLAIASLLLFCGMWAIWFFCYRYFLIWLEGFSFFSTLPDFSSLYRNIPEGFPAYVGAFLHQFYKFPALGAAIQSFFAVWPVICAGIIIIRLFKEPSRLLWMAFLPLPVFTYVQFWDILLHRAVIWFIVSGVLMLIVLIVTIFRKPEWNLPGLFRMKWLNPALMLVSVAVSVFFLIGLDHRNSEQEELAHLEYLGENREWGEILKKVSVKDAWENEMKRHYAFLALSETGQLTDFAFSYGLKGSDGFVFYDNINPLALNYNALFYQCLDMPNAVIHQAYQQGVQSVPGMGFAALRRLADTYLSLKDYTLAKKYIEILSHSTCHVRWVKERVSRLEAIRQAEPVYGHDEYKATISNFTHTISSMVDRNPENRKYADLLLCSMLADEEADKFKNLFKYVAQWQYPAGTSIPRLYEEALILISMIDPSVLDGVVISQETQQRFADYASLMNAGKVTYALRKYADTYWAYTYREN